MSQNHHATLYNSLQPANVYPGVAGLPADVVSEIKNQLERVDDDVEFNKLEQAMVSGDFSLWPNIHRLVEPHRRNPNIPAGIFPPGTQMQQVPPGMPPQQVQQAMYRPRAAAPGMMMAVQQRPQQVPVQQAMLGSSSMRPSGSARPPNFAVVQQPGFPVYQQPHMQQQQPFSPQQQQMIRAQQAQQAQIQAQKNAAGQHSSPVPSPQVPGPGVRPHFPQMNTPPQNPAQPPVTQRSSSSILGDGSTKRIATQAGTPQFPPNLGSAWSHIKEETAQQEEAKRQAEAQATAQAKAQQEEQAAKKRKVDEENEALRLKNEQLQKELEEMKAKESKRQEAKAAKERASRVLAEQMAQQRAQEQHAQAAQLAQQQQIQQQQRQHGAVPIPAAAAVSQQHAQAAQQQMLMQQALQQQQAAAQHHASASGAQQVQQKQGIKRGLEQPAEAAAKASPPKSSKKDGSPSGPNGLGRFEVGLRGPHVQKPPSQQRQRRHQVVDGPMKAPPLPIARIVHPKPKVPPSLVKNSTTPKGPPKSKQTHIGGHNLQILPTTKGSPSPAVAAVLGPGAKTPHLSAKTPSPTATPIVVPPSPGTFPSQSPHQRAALGGRPGSRVGSRATTPQESVSPLPPGSSGNSAVGTPPKDVFHTPGSSERASSSARLTPSRSLVDSSYGDDVVANQGIKRIKPIKAPQITEGSLVWRCHEHPQYRELFNFGEVKGEWLRAPERTSADPQSNNKVLGIHCDTIFVGRPANPDATRGENQKILEPHSLARIVVMNPEAHVLMDVLVRQRLPLLDLRPHLTQLTPDTLRKATCSFEEARLQLLHLLSPATILVGHGLHTQLRSLRIDHRYVVDTALLFRVKNGARGRYHRLHRLAKELLGKDHPAKPPMEPPAHVPLGGIALPIAHWNAWTALDPLDMEISQMTVNVQASDIENLFGSYGEIIEGPVWNLQTDDAQTWKGSCIVRCNTKPQRDWVWDAMPACVDVHVSWSTAQSGKITVDVLMRTFSKFGMVVGARVPQDAITKVYSPFGFVCFQHLEDAQSVVRMGQVDVQVTPSWSLTVKVKMANPSMTVKRVALNAGNLKQTDGKSMAEVIVIKKL